MKKLYKILAVELAIIGVLCVIKDLDIFAIPCLILYGVCLYRSERR